MLLSRLALLALLVALTGSALGCAEPAVDDVFAETGQEGPFDSVPEEGKADGVEALGPTILPGATTEVWAVRNQWTDTTTTEARLAETIVHLASGRTTVVIAHRLTTAARADRVVVMRDGAIVEDGSPHELLRRDDGEYARLWSAWRAAH